MIKDFDFHDFVTIWNHLENYKHDRGCFKINLRQNGVLHEDVGVSHLQSRPPPDPDPSDLFGQRVTSTNIKKRPGLDRVTRAEVVQGVVLQALGLASLVGQSMTMWMLIMVINTMIAVMVIRR